MIPAWVYAVLAALVIGGIAWRVARRWLIRRTLSAALRSRRESRRQAAVRECVEVGVAETAGLLVRHLRRESSAVVLRELAVALAERQWEPVSKASVLRLRIWAREYGIQHPQELADVKKVIALAGHAPAAASPPPGRELADTQVAASGAAGPDAAAAVAAAGQAAPAHHGAPRTAGQWRPVAPTTVLVSGARSPAAVASLGELRRLGHRLVAADSDAHAAGLRLADVAEVLPPPDDPGFVVCLVQAARDHGATAMICTGLEEQGALQTAAEELAAAGIRWAAPWPAALQACTDLGLLHNVLRDSGLATPPTPSARVPSAGIREFTADLLMSQSGQALGLATHWRLETAAGFPGRSETFTDDRVAEACIRAAKAVHLTGPASVLGYVGVDGQPVLVDASCYFSADLALSLRAGAGFVGQHLRQLFGLPVLVELLRPKAGVTVTREVRETFQE